MNKAKKRKIITVIGAVGVGKSTLVSLLTKKLSVELIPADKMFKKSPFFPLTINNRSRWSLTSDLWFLHQRVKAERIISNSVKKGCVVIDSGLPMSWVYARSRVGSGYYSNDEWVLYKELYDELTQEICLPDIVIYLKASASFLMKRINSRGREFEMRSYTYDYLESLNKNAMVLVRKYAKQGVKIIAFDVEKHDFLNNEADFMKLVGKVINEKSES